MIIMTDRASGLDWHDVTGTLMIHTAWHETQLKSQIKLTTSYNYVEKYQLKYRVAGPDYY